MKKVALFLLLFVVSVFSCSSNFKSCQQKVKDYKVDQNQTLYIPIDHYRTLVFSTKKLKHYQKYDPFLQLYIVQTSKFYRYPFHITHYPSKQQALVFRNKILCGLFHLRNSPFFYTYTKSIKKPGVLLNGCCELVAVATPKGVIATKFLQHFVKTKTIRYADIGVRFLQTKKGIIIITKNPFLRTSLQVGDVVLRMNGKTIKSLATLEDQILFSKIGTKLRFELLREGKKIQVVTTVYERKGGGFLSDSFLETKGIFLDHSLKVIQSSNSNFQKGDTIILVENKEVHTDFDIQQQLSSIQGELDIGIKRKGFLFFLHLKEF